MTLHELQKDLRTLRLGGMAEVLEVRVLEAQSGPLAPADFLSRLVDDELTRRADRLTKRRLHFARFRDPGRTLDVFDFGFNPKLNKKMVFELATCRFVEQAEDVLFIGPPGTGKSHLAQAIGHAAILAGHKVAYREAHLLLEELADAVLDGRRAEYMKAMMQISLLIIDDLGMRKLPTNAAEDLLEVIMRRHERVSTIITSNRPVEDWGKLLGDTAAVTALLDRVLHRGHVVTCGPRSYRTSRGKGRLPSEGGKE